MAKPKGWKNRIIENGVLPADQYNPHELNARRHPDEQRAALVGSLNAVGWVAPVIISAKSGKILDGHARVEEALARDPSTPVPYAKVNVTEQEERTILATFDPITAMATYEKQTLDALLREVETGEAALQSLLADLAKQQGLYEEVIPTQGDGGDDFNTAPAAQQTRVRAGDLWQLGNHRLLVGDSTNADDVIKLMNGERAVLFATDPPYLVEYDGMNHPSKIDEKTKRKEIKNKDWTDSYHDGDKAEEADGLYDGFIAVAIAHAIIPHAAWYCWHAFRKQVQVQAAWEKAGALVHEQIIWFKSRPVLTYSWYMWAHEPCFFGWIEGQKPERVAPDYPKTVWEISSKEVETNEHPTSKPIEVFAIPMRQHTKPGELCFEPFAGSGSQLIAAERFQRRCYAMEREPNYGEVIVRRWETETGLEAKLLERIDGHKAKPKTAQKANKTAANGKGKASAGGKAK